MGFLDWLRGSDREPETKDAAFERWVAQRGTQFLPPDTSGWPVADVSGGLWEAVRNYDGPGSYSAIYRSQPSVYTVVEFLAWQLSQIGIKVYRRKGDTDREHLKDSPLSRLLHDPAPGLTYNRLMHRTVADLCIFGNCYWLKLELPTRLGGGRSITPLPASLVTPRGGSLIEADVYEVTIGGERRSFDATEVVHFRRYSPDDLRIGVSPLEPLRRIIAEEVSASRAREVFWRKSARMDGILERGADAPPWDDNTRKRFREDWRKFARGGALEGDTVVLEDSLTYRPISFSPKEAEFISGRKLTLETVARAFNIPLSVLGLTETATYASQKEFHTALYQDTLAPWTRMLESEIQAELVPWFGEDSNVYVEFNLEEKLKGSFEEQVEGIWRAVGTPWVTVPEARSRLNLPKEIPGQLAIPAGVTFGDSTQAPESPAPDEVAAPVVQIAPRR